MTKRHNSTIYLLPGQLFIAEACETVWTLLGSCVTIILHHPPTHTSAICHAQLPAPGAKSSCKESCPHPCEKNELDDFKYVSCAFNYMWQYFQQKNIPRQQLQISLFGGANMYDAPVHMRIGDKNIAAAKELLERHYLRIQMEDIGGNQARKLLHDSTTGFTEVTK